MIKEFKEFAMKGSLLDMAVGIILGIAFGKIITSFVADVLMPPIGMLLGGLDFSNMFINLSGQAYATLEQAKADGAPGIGYGLFINTVIDFLIVAFILFLIIKQMNRGKEAAPAPKECPFCLTSIPAAATRCPACTSEQPAA